MKCPTERSVSMSCTRLEAAPGPPPECTRTGSGIAYVLLVLLLIGGLGFAGRVEAQASLVGNWETLPYMMPLNPIHVGLLHTSKILVIAGSENDPTVTTYRAAVYDPNAGTIRPQMVPWDLFCNALSYLADGRVLVTGGTLQYDPFHGLPTTTIFDPATEKVIQVQDMAHGRWYPSNVALNDGRTMTFSGLAEDGSLNTAVELYDVLSGWTPEYPAPWRPPLYPRLHLAPDGTIFYSGSTSSSHVYDPTTAAWTLNVARTNYAGDRFFGSSVLLPLLPELSYAPRVMIMGGNSPATATAEVIDLSEPTPTWRSLPPMSAPRVDMNAVLLPTGKVLALGGSGLHEVPSTASLAADLFDPATETWSPAGVAAFARLYHSVALLLPDATVWVAGSNPVRGTYEQHMEIYSPAYLFTKDASGADVRAARPTITSAPPRIGYNAPFEIQAPNATDIAAIVLIRPGADTHAFDMEQRIIGLDFTVNPGGVLTITSPPNAGIAPPGYYMLFIVNQNGVPSVAPFIQLSPYPTTRPPKGEITAPTTDVAVGAGEAVMFVGNASSPDGIVSSYLWIFPGGTPATSDEQNPGPVSFTEAGTYVVSLTVFDDLGVNDPSPPTVTVTVRSPLVPPGP